MSNWDWIANLATSCARDEEGEFAALVAMQATTVTVGIDPPWPTDRWSSSTLGLSYGLYSPTQIGPISFGTGRWRHAFEGVKQPPSLSFFTSNITAQVVEESDVSSRPGNDCCFMDVLFAVVPFGIELGVPVSQAPTITVAYGHYGNLPATGDVRPLTALSSPSPGIVNGTGPDGTGEQAYYTITITELIRPPHWPNGPIGPTEP